MADEHRVAGHLGVAADDYDRTIRRFIPNYERMIATIVHWLEGHVPAHGLVVDLGAGTGGLSAAILDALPAVRVQLVDVDPNMLEVAAVRCAAHEGRYELRHARFEDDLARCDAVVAMLALHHVTTHDEKRELYRAILDALEPAGLLVVGDLLVHPDGPERRGMLRDYYAHMADNGISAEEAMGTSPSGPKRTSTSRSPTSWRSSARPASRVRSASGGTVASRSTAGSPLAGELVRPSSRSRSIDQRREENSMAKPTSAEREVLPIPDRPYDGPVYEDAKDPAAKFPPIEPLRPPAGAPNVLIVLIDDAGFGCSSAFGGPCQTPDGRAPGRRRAEVQPLPHDGAVLADARGAALGPQPPLASAWAGSRRSRPRRRATTRSARTRARRWPRR